MSDEKKKVKMTSKQRRESRRKLFDAFEDVVEFVGHENRIVSGAAEAWLFDFAMEGIAFCDGKLAAKLWFRIEEFSRKLAKTEGEKRMIAMAMKMRIDKYKTIRDGFQAIRCTMAVVLGASKGKRKKAEGEEWQDGGGEDPGLWLSVDMGRDVIDYYSDGVPEHDRSLESLLEMVSLIKRAISALETGEKIPGVSTEILTPDDLEKMAQEEAVSGGEPTETTTADIESFFGTISGGDESWRFN